MSRFGTDDDEVFDERQPEEGMGGDEDGLPDVKADHDD